MITFTDNLYKLTNTETGQIYYCLTPTSFCDIIGCAQSTRYAFSKTGKFKQWKLELIDGKHIEWGDIYKGRKC